MPMSRRLEARKTAARRTRSSDLLDLEESEPKSIRGFASRTKSHRIFLDIFPNGLFFKKINSIGKESKLVIPYDQLCFTTCELDQVLGISFFHKEKPKKTRSVSRITYA